MPHPFSPAILVFAALTAGVTLPAPAQTNHVYFGNLHSHTSYSDGSGTPEQAYTHARTVAHLDFLAITEHNHKAAENGAGERKDGLLIATDPSLYTGPDASSLIPAANRLTENGHFVAIYGQEFSSISSGNHANVFDVDQVITAPNGRFDLLLDWLDAHRDGSGDPPVVQFNHPGLFQDDSRAYGADDFASQAEWVRRMGNEAALIEVLNGPAMTETPVHRAAERMESDYLRYLNLGFHLAPTADQDNHYLTWGDASDARTAIIAPALTRRDLIAAMRARHVYATEDPNLEVMVTVNGHLAGDIITTLPAVGSALDIRFTLNDRDEPASAYQIEVYSDDQAGGPNATRLDLFSIPAEADPTQEHRITDITYHGAGQYLFFKIRQISEDGDDDYAWTAPVWFAGPAGPATPPAATLAIASLLANPAGDERTDEEVTLRNPGGHSVSLAGWVLRDLAGQDWSLSGTIPAGGERTIKRNGQKMSLNNTGDTIFLIDPQGITVHTVTYPAQGEGVRFVTP